MTHQRFTHPLLGCCLYLGAVVVLLGAIAYMPLREASTRKADGSRLAEEQKEAIKTTSHHLFFFVAMPVAAWLVACGRRLRSRTPSEALSADKRQPVLYFRSFKDDGTIANDYLRRVFSFSLFTRGESEEEAYVRCLSKVGPVVAIGDPNERIPMGGAARYYSSNDEWQSLAHKLLNSAALVVYRIGLTDGLVWEIKRGKQFIHPSKVLFLMPDPYIYKQFQAKVRDVFSLPERYPGPLIVFDDTWHARAIALHWWSTPYSVLNHWLAGNKMVHRTFP